MRGWAVLPLIMLGQIALAAGPDSSERPVARQQGDSLPVSVAPGGAIAPPERDPAARAAAEGGQGMKASLRPTLRSAKVEQAARARQRMLAKGAVCGDLLFHPGHTSDSGVNNSNLRVIKACIPQLF